MNNKNVNIMDDNVNMMDLDPNANAVFDINWSHDGTVVAACFELSIIMLDMNKLLSQSVESIIEKGKTD